MRTSQHASLAEIYIQIPSMHHLNLTTTQLILSMLHRLIILHDALGTIAEVETQEQGTVKLRTNIISGHCI